MSILSAGATLTAVIAALASLFGAAAQAQQPVCSAWLIESSRFMNVPFGSFMPDRAFVPGSTKPESNIPSVDLPANIGVIKCGNELIVDGEIEILPGVRIHPAFRAHTVGAQLLEVPTSIG